MVAPTSALRRTARRRTLALLALSCAITANRARGSSRACVQTSSGALQSAITALRSAVALRGLGERPPADNVLQAALDAQRQRLSLNSQAPFYQKLTGDGKDGGKRWRLVYLANKNAVLAARKGNEPSLFDKPLYVDGFVTAVQRFEDSPSQRMNQNGVFEFLGLGGFFFGYFARFKWPSPTTRTTMAFEPLTNSLHAFGQSWAWPFAGTLPGEEGARRFEKGRLQDSNIFNFFYIDDEVAVAQGASGGVAVWGATDAAWEAEHLVAVEGPPSA